MRQLSEAQDLKDHVDHREQTVSRVLARCLLPEQHRDYRYEHVSIHLALNTGGLLKPNRLSNLRLK